MTLRVIPLTRPLQALASIVLTGVGSCCLAAPEEIALTIYSSQQPGAIQPELYRPLPGAAVAEASSIPGYAMVRQERDVKIPSGRSTLRFVDVAALIDPTTVTFSSLTEPRTRVLEQTYQFDLVSTGKLLLKYIDKPISVEYQSGDHSATVTGTLLSAGDGLVLRTSDGAIQALRNYSAVHFPELPGGLDTRPTLVWDVLSPQAGEQRTRVSYQTGGITWWADYNLVLKEGRDANGGVLDLSAWVSIINQSGAGYPNARLKLIAGDVHRVTPESRQGMYRRNMDVEVAAAAPVPGFKEQSFFEFHLYTLQRPATLPNNSTRQLELFDKAQQIPARRILVYDPSGMSYLPGSPVTDRNFGTQSGGQVAVYLEFRNAKDHGLGMPLPAGRVRVAKVDSDDGSLEFIGEDSIAHTARDEQVRVRLGSAFDIVGERRQTDFLLDSKGHTLEEEFEVRLRNHKSQAVQVLVKEHLNRWSNWSIIRNSSDFTKDDARTITFPIEVPKDGESQLRYRVRYSW